MICEASRHFDWGIDRLGQETSCGMDQAKIRCIRWGSRRNSGGYKGDKQREGKKGDLLGMLRIFSQVQRYTKDKGRISAFVFFVRGDEATNAVVSRIMAEDVWGD